MMNFKPVLKINCNGTDLHAANLSDLGLSWEIIA
jgi:hypothetical protein